MPFIKFTIARGRREKGERTGSAGIFASGYIVVWAAFSMVLAGAVLIAAGIYQLTPLKQACLRRCRSPLEFMLTQWREGTRGAFLMGCRHGAYCVGCCWLLMLMLLLFVGGVMNLAWIAGLAVFVLMEKLAPAGHWVGWGAGLALIGWGTATLLTAI